MCIQVLEEPSASLAVLTFQGSLLRQPGMERNRDEQKSMRPKHPPGFLEHLIRAVFEMLDNAERHIYAKSTVRKWQPTYIALQKLDIGKGVLRRDKSRQREIYPHDVVASPLQGNHPLRQPAARLDDRLSWINVPTEYAPELGRADMRQLALRAQGGPLFAPVIRHKAIFVLFAD